MLSERPNSKLTNRKLQHTKKSTSISDNNFVDPIAHPPNGNTEPRKKVTIKSPKSPRKFNKDEQPKLESTIDVGELVKDDDEVAGDSNDCGDQGQQPLSPEVSLVDVMHASIGVPASSDCACSNSTALSTKGKAVTFVEQKRFITSDRINKLRRIALDAAKQHKTFTIRGCFYSIRRGLMARGWVEKFDIHRRQTGQVLCQSTGMANEMELLLPECKPGSSRRAHISKCERNIVSRFLENKPIDFLWCARKERSDFTDMVKNPGMTVSRLNRNPFTSKSGMCSVLRDFHWFFEEGTAELYYPRSYNVFLADDLAEFIDDFRMSACIAMLRYFVESADNDCYNTNNEDDAGWSPTTIPVTAVQFAIEQCRRYVRSAQHLDIDETNPTTTDRVTEDHDWEVFLNHHHSLTVDGGWLAPNEQTPFLMGQAATMLTQVEPHWAQYSLDGVRNIWIVKPSNRCRGRGIRLMNDLRKIVEFVNPAAYLNKGHWVVQKYIERPLIIHNCKFDIRQWFLVTSVQPLTIWMYRESYLRFSSQEFSLVNLHESVHLTNHAVQKRYRNDDLRDQRLPKENMWDCHTFQAYLRQIGETDQWANRIYPGMQRALIGTMLASQELMDRRANTFELFGADFMVTEDFQPWLIEINSSPDLAASTSVTARMCPQCLDDLVKVVIDYRNNPKAPTGEFELIYKQSVPPAPSYLGLDLYLVGTQMHKSNHSKIVRSISTSPRNTTVNPTPRRPPTRARRTPMPMIKTPRIDSTDNPPSAVQPPPSSSTARTISPRRITKQTVSKKPPSSVQTIQDPPKTELEILLANCTPRATPRIATSHSAAHSPAMAMQHNRSSNRILSSIMTPTSQVLRDIKNRERVADLRRRHALCGNRVGGGGPAAVSSFVKNVLSELTDFRCVGNKLVSRDKSLAIRRVPEVEASHSLMIGAMADGSPKRLHKDDALADAAGRLLRRRSKSRKKGCSDGGGGNKVDEAGKGKDMFLRPPSMSVRVGDGRRGESILF